MPMGSFERKTREFIERRRAEQDRIAGASPGFQLGGDVLEGALNRYQRDRPGIPEDVAAKYRSSLASTAFTAGRGAEHQITRGLRQRGLQKSTAFLSAPQTGARVAGDIAGKGNLDFALAQAAARERGRATDIGFGQQLLALLSRRDLTKRQLELALRQMQEAADAQPDLTVNTPVGGISF